MQPVEHKIWHMIEDGVVDLGLRLVRVRLSGGADNSVLQIMIEPEEASPTNHVSVKLEDCEQISRMASAILDVEDPINSAYTLEVSSTGIERPLVTPRDFEVYALQTARLETTETVEGRRRFRGTVLGMEGNEILFKAEEGEEYRIPMQFLKNARLVDNAQIAHN